MNIDETIDWLKEMQNPAMSESDLYCAATCYGSGEMVYPDPEDYALDEAINGLEQLKEYRQLEEQGKLIKIPCKSDTGYVIKDADGLYFIGYGKFDVQLRKAKIYHSVRHAGNIMNDSRFVDKNLRLSSVIIMEGENVYDHNPKPKKN